VRGSSNLSPSAAAAQPEACRLIPAMGRDSRPTGWTGSGTVVNNIQPYTSLTYLIAVIGVSPARW
jgi:microcystin-dependent protein